MQPKPHHLNLRLNTNTKTKTKKQEHQRKHFRVFPVTMSTAKLSPATSALSSTIRRLNCNLLLPQNCAVFRHNSNRLRPHRSCRRSFTVALSSAASPLEVCVKASTTTPSKLGDCPFCQRVLLTLEEKHIPYDMKLVDLVNKPDWFLKISADGKVPVIKFEEKWVADSDVITQSLEEKYPNPPLGTPPEKASVGSKIFSAFIGFLKSKDPSDGTEQTLLNELSAFNDYIKDNGPFVNGKEISAVDLSLGPKLYHLEIALGHYKKWTVPDSLLYLKSYMKIIFSMDSFIKTRALPEDVIAGWQPKVMGA
ncbi:glutathione S-transferase DHAR3, chloroplastic [Malania oleifera]|uniref:glutathione S-transferase DHAR3, chloroplastic n=1 Tax=Malania oleifera TaxID=397392 RepID=UPI0025AE44E5|nr:glutathione S-transferase DHAR3, chloroplastic [Malania oleifera]XP_057972071.1 glutathione S-transferase DHAR3, chloroplastic [Malania oleifera]